MANNDFIDSILCDCVMAVVCPLGEFYPDKDYGSQIKNWAGIDSDILLAYARQAVNEIDGVHIKSVKAENNKALFNVVINDSERQVSIDI